MKSLLTSARKLARWLTVNGHVSVALVGSLVDALPSVSDNLPQPSEQEKVTEPKGKGKKRRNCGEEKYQEVEREQQLNGS